jgi:hypothetical protein
MNDLIKSLPSPFAYIGNYSHMDGEIIDGSWTGVGDDDGDDILQPSRQGARTEFLIPNYGF